MKQQLKVVKMLTIPKCDFCTELAEYDAPTSVGPWAYMCSRHYEIEGSSPIGTKLELKKQLPPVDKIVLGLEDDSEEYMEEAYLDGYRSIECPECGDMHDVELDARYAYLCDCGVKVQVPEGLL